LLSSSPHCNWSTSLDNTTPTSVSARSAMWDFLGLLHREKEGMWLYFLYSCQISMLIDGYIQKLMRLRASWLHTCVSWKKLWLLCTPSSCCQLMEFYYSLLLVVQVSLIFTH
jgi:hypothetical protein